MDKIEEIYRTSKIVLVHTPVSESNIGDIRVTVIDEEYQKKLYAKSFCSTYTRRKGYGKYADLGLWLRNLRESKKYFGRIKRLLLNPPEKVQINKTLLEMLLKNEENDLNEAVFDLADYVRMFIPDP
ncbi:hypothetical protein J4221_02705 [Candidatus Pacearchaeota archaeon]|nr:hypothetical protein [Candidatus Pacearchaeota archaeon]